MKAQSELMGDHERTAEMTVPRFDGATNWMSIGETVDQMNRGACTITASAAELAKDVMSKHLSDAFSFGAGPVSMALGIADRTPTLTSSIALSSKDYDNEVSHRPAGQQWPVCTP